MTHNILAAMGLVHGSRRQFPIMSPSAVFQAVPGFDSYTVTQACRRHFLQRLTAIVQEQGVRESWALEALGNGLGTLFDDLLKVNRRSGFAQADGLTASRISLVDDNQLEQELRRDEIARRLYEHCSESLWRLHLRCISLLQRQDLALKDNPFSPDLICQGLAFLCGALGRNQDQIMDFLDQLETALHQHLPALYGELQELLAQSGVPSASVQRNIIQGPSGPVEGASVGEDPLAFLKGALLGQGAGASLAPGLVFSSPAGGAAQVADADALERLLDRLKTLDAFTPTNPDLINLVPGGDNSAPLPLSLSSQKLGVAGPDGASIDALALIFEAIFTHAGLAEGARAAIVSLQIPILKLAIQDRSFFSGREHPARQTLDRMAQLATGLPPSAGFDHPVCRRLNQVAGSIRGTQPMTVAVFEAALLELDKAIAQRNSDVQSLANRYQGLAEGVVQQDLAGQEARQLVASYLATPLPAPFVSFLTEDWMPVLQAAYLQGGTGGRAWQEARALMDDLLWSIVPKQSLEERQKLAALVPTLLKRITAALAAIGRSLDAQSPFLDTCFALQTAAMRGRSLPVEAVAAPAKEGAPPAIGTPAFRGEPRLGEVRADGLLLKVLEQPGESPAPFKEAVANLGTGEWLEFPLPDGVRVCGRLSWQSSQGDWLFANPDWDCAILARAGVLAPLLRNGKALCCNRVSLFDAVAEKAGELMAARA